MTNRPGSHLSCRQSFTGPDTRRAVSREEAVVALGESDIEPCQICNPQTGLQAVEQRLVR
ncbi:DUF6233 domain-containing protein [Streptomyces sp. NPDC058409]|uniref:DUF6233 domain-containing protein n=1 Tax=Streptomyces sp. NPDC058409 TaxID=3346484 RepID=UPI0036487E81